MICIYIYIYLVEYTVYHSIPYLFSTRNHLHHHATHLVAGTEMWFGGFNDAVLHDQKWCLGEDPLLLGKRPIFMGALLLVLGKIFYEAKLWTRML